MPRDVGCDFFAGWSSGVAGLLVGHPWDSVKVVAQVYGLETNSAVRKIKENGGFRGFYRGLAMPLLSSGVLNSLTFGVYGFTVGAIDKYRRLFMNPSELATLHSEPVFKAHHGRYHDIFLAGCISGAAQVPFACPAELIKTRCQTSVGSGSPTSTRNVIRAIQRREGFKGFFRGGTAMLYRDTPSTGVYMLSYEYLKDLFVSWSGHRPNLIHHFVAGGSAGTLSWLCVIPFDILKSRIQSSDVLQEAKTSVFAGLRSIWRSEGIRGLTRGILPITLRAFPVNGVTFVAYEHVYKRCALAYQDSQETKPAEKDKSIYELICENNKRTCYCRKI